MWRKYLISGMLIFVSLLIFKANVYTAETNRLGRLFVDEPNQSIDIWFECDSGGWIGCSVYTSYGRQDLEAKYVVGRDKATFSLPNGAREVTVALWKERYNLGEGPEPNNPWAKKNGYYLYKELDRETIKRDSSYWKK